ncbi:MAG TPA: iron-sulfur cluster carrier protein ApbC [Stellaceae bacterium]|nr:iron-sulfur cluster carrier protein ApbC [Stellaceae bacterium]
MSVTESAVRAALQHVNDPDRGQDIITLGMISGVQVRDGHVAFAIEVERERGPRLEPLRKAAEKAVEAIDGVLSVSAVLTAEAGPAPRAAAPRAAAAPAAEKLVPGARAIIAVASGKGGVGKSTTAANLALGLAAIGRSVGVLDADIYGPSMPRMLGISGRPRMADGKRLEPMTNYGIKCMSMGFLVAEDTPMIWRGPMVMSALQQMLRDVNWGALDVMVVDMPPGTGDAQLTMAQQVPLAGAVIVSTPQDIALLDARKGLNMFRKVDVPVLGIIENMSYFRCPHCGERSNIFSHGGARLEAERLGIEFLGELPLDMAIRETSDGGRPIVIADPESEHAKVYRGIAARIWEKLSASEQPVPRIVVQ